MYPKSIPNIHNEILSFISFYLADLKDCKVLDAAAGNGFFSHELKKINGYVDIYQIDKDINDLILNGFNPIEYDLNNDLPFKDSYFDLVVSIETIEHLENPYHFISELHRVAKKNSYIIISTPNIISARSRIRNFLTCLPSMFEYIENDEFGQHITQVGFPVFHYLSLLKDMEIFLVLSSSFKNNVLSNFVFQLSNVVTLCYIYFSKIFKKKNFMFKKYSNKMIFNIIKGDILIIVYKKES